MKTHKFIAILLSTWAALSTYGATVTTPEPRITTPAGKYTINQVTVEGTTTPNSGITSVQYLFDGNGPYTATQLNASNWNKWEASVSLAAGSNIFQVWAIGVNGSSRTNTANYFLTEKTVVTVSVVGLGRVVPNYNNQNLIVGRAYTMRAVPAAGQTFAGWSGTVTTTDPVLTFDVQSNENLTATFEPSPFTNGLNGVYDGLFYDSNNLSEASVGYFTLTVSGANGSFTGSIMLDGQRDSFSHQLAGDGTAQFTIPRSRTEGDLLLSLALDISGSNGITGTIISTNATNSFDAILRAYKVTQKNTNYAGYYTFAMDNSFEGIDGIIPQPGPIGYSFGTITVPTNGSATISLYLATGYSTVLRDQITDDGMLPLYISLNGGHSSLSGWLKFETNDLSTNVVQWFQNPLKGSPYPDGFALANLPLIASPYVRGSNSFGSTNVVVEFSGADLTGTLTDLVTLNVKSNSIALAPDHVTISLNLATGLFTGTFLDPADDKTAKFQGVVVQPAAGYGYFTATNRVSGAVNLYAR